MTEMSAVTEYRHIAKLIDPAPSLALGDAILKWYDIAPEGEPVPAEIRQLARDGLEQAEAAGALDLSGDLGFVILHRCGESFYFLIASTWRNNNEVWETVWAKNGDGEDAFSPWTTEGRTARRSVSGSSARSGTSSRPGAVTCAPSATTRRSRPICGTPTKDPSEPTASAARRRSFARGAVLQSPDNPSVAFAARCARSSPCWAFCWASSSPLRRSQPTNRLRTGWRSAAV